MLFCGHYGIRLGLPSKVIFKAILSVKKHLLQCHLHGVSKESASCEVCPSLFHKITKTSETLLSRRCYQRHHNCLSQLELMRVCVTSSWSLNSGQEEWREESASCEVCPSLSFCRFVKTSQSCYLICSK